MDPQDTLHSMAYIRGRKDGKSFLAPSLNPYPDGSAEAAEYLRGWQSSNVEQMNQANTTARAEWWADRRDFDSEYFNRGRARR